MPLCATAHAARRRTGIGLSNGSEALRQLAHDYWESLLRLNPTLATFYGDYRYNDRLPDVGPIGRAEEASFLREVLTRLDALPPQAVELDAGGLVV